MAKPTDAPKEQNGTALVEPEKAGLAESSASNKAKIKQLFEGQSAKLAELVPRHLTPERLVKVALAAIFKTPGLAECNPLTLLNSFIQATQLGLECNGALGHAYLVPFNAKIKERGPDGVERERFEKQCQFILGYRGMIELARRTGQVASIEAVVVRVGDVFEEERGINQVLRHVPNREGVLKPLRLVYAIARLKGGETCIEVMSRAEIDAIRARSKASKFGPWVSDYEEMARKTVVRRLFKMLPTSIEIAGAIADDDDRTDIVDAEFTRRDNETKSEALARQIAEKPKSEPLDLESVPQSEPEFSTNSGNDPDGEPVGNLFN